MNNEFIKKIKETKNPYFVKDILTIYLKKEKFIKNVLKDIDYIWIKKEKGNKIEKIIDLLSKNKKNYIDKNGNDIYFKKRSIWCTYCTMWKWCTVVLSYKCNRTCFFCYEETPLNPKNIIDPYNKDDIEKIYQTIDNSFLEQSNMTLAITWWEPFLFPDKVYEILEYVNKNYSWKNTRIYSTWDLVTEEILKKLNFLWLNEIRYSIKPWEEPNIELYKKTKKYIPSVLIEMPVIPGSKKYMIDIMAKIDKSKSIDWINLNELTYNNVNANKFKNRWLKLDLPDNNNEVYHRYYDISKVEIWVYWSKYLCLELLEYFSKKNSSFFIHYCDLNTVSRHHYLHKIKNAKLLNIPYSEITNFWLHKVFRIYSNIEEALKILNNNNIKNFSYNKNIIETSIDNIRFFKNKWFLSCIIYKNFDYKYDVDFELMNN